ncbi:MAG: aKG-HExxH-type peptide beta-hydroxylase, partial [Nitrospiraceae bacterium]
MKLFDQGALASLQAEFLRAMRTLLTDLCDDLEKNYSSEVKGFRLPIGYFRFLQNHLNEEDYSGWKVVGWIEELNDLLYFIDVRQQLQKERDRHGFTEAFFLDCEEKFYENSSKDELFPAGIPYVAGLASRLSVLCRRLAQQIIQESLFLVRALPCRWLAHTSPRHWTVPGSLQPNFERAELGGCLYVGLAGGYYEPPPAVRQRIIAASRNVEFVIRSKGIGVRVGSMVFPILDVHPQLKWHWRFRPPCSLDGASSNSITVGPSLIYGRNRVPTAVGSTPEDFADRLERAMAVIRVAWPEGTTLLTSLTSRIVPLRARGVVSFSYRHRPGLSFINCFDRDDLDLIDDLIHENSHHHLNLLLRKHKMIQGDRHQEIFYSPWRRSLRPLRGILHATFTFTMGAILFERLSSWAEGPQGLSRWKRAGLRQRDLMRVRFRCLEEVESVRYSIQDLEYASRHLGWLTGSGQRLVGQLEEAIGKVERNMASYRKEVFRSNFGPALRRHVEELKRARQTYGLTRLCKV